jgi:hypothetical protein
VGERKCGSMVPASFRGRPRKPHDGAPHAGDAKDSSLSNVLIDVAGAGRFHRGITSA